MAEDIIENHGVDEQNWHDAIHETVDSSRWIIYYSNHEIVLNESKNEPDDSEVASMSGKNSNWRSLRQTAAFLAMEADLRETLREKVNDYFECNHCGAIEKREFVEEGDFCRNCLNVGVPDED